MSDYRHKKGYSSSGRSRSPYRERSRSRSPDDRYRKNSSPPQRINKNRSSDSEDHLPPAPPPPLISKPPVTIPKFKPPKIGIQLKLNPAQKPKEPTKPAKVASVFGNDSDDEPEEMPAEAKMRMRNIGRDTPTSSGPNSYGKTKQGFCDSKKIFERQLKRLDSD